MEITPKMLEALRLDLDAAMKPIAAKYGIELTSGNASYQSSSFSLKVAGKVCGAKSQEAVRYEQNEKWMNLPPLGSDVTIGRDVFTIDGMKARGEKCILITRKKDGKNFVCGVSNLPRKKTPPTLSLVDFVAEVNRISKAECKGDKTSGKLFPLVHIPLPEVMLKHYHEEGMTPQETMDSINTESAAEGRAEALAS